MHPYFLRLSCAKKIILLVVVVVVIAGIILEDISDNFFITGNSENAKSSAKIKKKSRLINYHNIEIFKTKIESTDWLVAEESDINTTYDLFNNSLPKMYEE